MCDWNHQQGSSLKHLQKSTCTGPPYSMPPSCFTWQNAVLNQQTTVKISPNFRGRTDLMGRIMESSKEPWWTSARKKYVMAFSSIAWYGDTVNNHEQPNILKNVVNKKQDIQFSISCHSWHIHCFDAGQPGSCGWTRQCLLLHDHLYPTNWTKHEDLHLWQTQMTWGKFTLTMDESPCRRTVEKRHCCLESWTSHMHFGGLKDSSNHHCQSPRSKQIDSRHPHVAWNTERHWWIGPISDSGGLRRLWWPTLVHRFLPKFQALEHLGRLQLATIGVFHQCNRIR